MSELNGSTASLWTTINPPAFPTLNSEISTDVCIVGAGIAGLTTAYLLTQTGKRVVVLDKGEIGAGESCRSTAHITHALDDRYIEIERWFGQDGARLAAESHTAAIDLIEDIVRRHHIDCDFKRVDGYLFNSPEQPNDLLGNELAAVQRAGLGGVEFVPRAPLEFDTGRCLRFPRQAQFHPVKYLNALASIISAQGGHIYTHTRVVDVRGGANARVDTATGARVHAQDLVLATNTPINDVVVMHTKQAPYRTYAMAFEIMRASVARGLYWDTADPYHYIRVAEGESSDVLIVGGEDHKCGQQDDGALRFQQLEHWTRERFPQAKDILYRWSGQVMEPIDGLAYIGNNPLDASNVYIATGDSGNGITHGTLAGILLRDLLLQKSNEWAEIYAPKRKNVTALSEYFHENLNVAKQYTDWLTSGTVETAVEIPCGSGAILRQGAHKIAAYRDADDVLHTCNATCPHLGCVVAWNSTEHSWDCPCHGSRFDAYGSLLNGPALHDLASCESSPSESAQEKTKTATTRPQ